MDHHVSDGGSRIAIINHWTKNELSGGESKDTIKVRYQYSNHLGSASLELDESGGFVSYQEYFPFGETAYTLGEVSTEYRFTGKERDSFTGLYYFGARYYAPWMFRWMSADPSGPVDGLNVFVYVSNQPIIMVDPDGRFKLIVNKFTEENHGHEHPIDYPAHFNLLTEKDIHGHEHELGYPEHFHIHEGESSDTVEVESGYVYDESLSEWENEENYWKYVREKRIKEVNEAIESIDSEFDELILNASSKKEIKKLKKQKNKRLRRYGYGGFTSGGSFIFADWGGENEEFAKNYPSSKYFRYNRAIEKNSKSNGLIKKGLVLLDKLTLRLSPQTAYDEMMGMGMQGCGMKMKGGGFKASPKGGKLPKKPTLKWGNPQSKPTYGHTFLEHGRKLKLQQLFDRARSLGHQIGQFLDDNKAAKAISELFEKMDPNKKVQDFILPEGLDTRVALPDGAVTTANKVRLVRNSKTGGLKTSIPFNSNYPN